MRIDLRLYIYYEIKSDYGLLSIIESLSGFTLLKIRYNDLISHIAGKFDRSFDPLDCVDPIDAVDPVDAVNFIEPIDPLDPVILSILSLLYVLFIPCSLLQLSYPF